MPQYFEQALRFRNYAEELRVIAGDKSTPEDRERLLRVASNYDRMAGQLEAVSTVKREQGLSL